MGENLKPYPESVAKHFPPSRRVPEKRKIIKCSIPGEWYEKEIGTTVTVYCFWTFGCWDIHGRWISFYDLSKPLKNMNLFTYLYYELKYRFIRFFTGLFN